MWFVDIFIHNLFLFAQLLPPFTNLVFFPAPTTPKLKPKNRSYLKYKIQRALSSLCERVRVCLCVSAFPYRC